MKHPEFNCCHCGSTNLKRSHSTSLVDLPKKALGIYPFRCLDCKERSWINIWLFSKGKQAVCPRCLSLNVLPAGAQRTQMSLLKKLYVAAGARRYRCSACNCKFYSFKAAQAAQDPGPMQSPDTPSQAQPESSEMAATARAGN